MLLFLVVPSILAQPIKFKHLGLREGLSESSVYAIQQDRQGFMWIATADGLNRYDGYGFYVYRKERRDSLHSLNQNGVWALGVDSLGNIWAGLMSRGLSRIDARSGVVTNFQHRSGDSASLSSNRVRIIHCDGRGFVWVGTADAGLNRIDIRTQEIRQPSGLPGLRIKDVLEDQGGALLVATADSGLFRVHPYRLTAHHIPLSFNGHPFTGTVETIYLDKVGILWISTLNSGLYRSEISYKMWRSSGRSPEAALPLERFSGAGSEGRVLSREIVKTIHDDANGHLWFGTFTGGLFQLDRKKQRLRQIRHHTFDPFSLSNDQVFCLFLDRTGILWIGTNGGGVCLLDERWNAFQLYGLYPEKKYSLPDRMVRSVVTDRSGAIWVGTSHGGLARIDARSGQVMPIYIHPDPPRTPGTEDVRSLLIDSKGYLWLGTYGDGLWRLEPQVASFDQQPLPTCHFRAYPYSANIKIGRVIWCLLEDHRGYIWMGTNDGLFRLNPATGNWRRYASNPADPHGLQYRIVRGLWLDRQNRLWIATYRGLHRLLLKSEDEKAGKFEVYKHNSNDPTSLSSNAVVALWEHPDGYLWLGTFGGGLNLMKTNQSRFRHWGREAGLSSEDVVGIRHDTMGNLWISTISGLCQIHLGELMEKRSEDSLKVQIFTEQDGLQSNEFDVGAVHRDDRGWLYFGGVKGLNRFQPQKLLKSWGTYPVVLTDIRLFNKPINTRRLPSALQRLELSYTQNFLSLAFSNLTYHNPSGVRYRFRLRGLQERWQELRGTNRVVYASLPPGEYYFEVTSVTPDGSKNSRITRLEIDIAPPFWLTWWFGLLVGGVIALGLYGLYRYRLSKERALQQTRARIAADLHDEVASSLASVRLYSEVIARKVSGQNPQAIRLLDRVQHQVQEATESIGEIIWSVDPRHDRLEDLLDRINEFARHTLQAAGIEYYFQGDRRVEQLPLSPQQRRGLYLILKEAITNVLRHSDADRFTLRCDQQGAFLEFTLEDNGSGFGRQSNQSGRGLGNMRRRADELGAELKIDGGPPGTRIHIRLKIT